VGEALDQLGGCDDIRQGIVSAYGDQLVVGELADDGGGLVALLLLRQLVAIQGDDALDVATVQGLLVELNAQLEADGRGLEGGGGSQGVGIALQGHLHCGAQAVAHLARHQTDACKWKGKRNPRN